jgi:hypothetical protein
VIATPPARRTSSRRGIEMNSSNPLQTEESGIGNDIYYATSAVSPNANHQVQRVPLFTVDRTVKPVPNAAQTLEDQQFEDPESQELFLQCLTPVWHRDICVFARQWEEYSNEAHLSAVKAAIKYSESHLQSQDDFSPDFEASDDDDELSRLQNPTKTPIILKEFLRVLPHCPTIHWVFQMCNNPKLCFCPCSILSQPWREKNIFIDDDHGCKATAMTPQELLKHLKNESDSTYTAISIYLQKLNTFSQGHVRQDPGVNSKKKPDSDEEEKEEEEREEEEEELAAALDSNDVSREQVDTYACDHAKQGLETQIASDNHKDPVSEVIDGCQSAKMYWMT